MNAHEILEEGNCRDINVVVMYPNEKDANELAAARAVCVGCPVVRECLELAIRTHEDFGYWGGHTTTERKSIERKWQRNERLKSV